MSIPRLPISKASPSGSTAQFAGDQVVGQCARSFSFGPFMLQPERQRLLNFGMPIRIGGRALDLLTLLVERAGELVTKQQLVSRAWPDTFVEASNLKVNIAGLRRTLDERPDVPHFIATVVGRGYRFVAPVALLSPLNVISLEAAHFETTQPDLRLEPPCSELARANPD